MQIAGKKYWQKSSGLWTQRFAKTVPQQHGHQQIMFLSLLIYC